MPNEDLPQAAPAAEPTPPSAQATATQAKPGLRDRFTGGWRRPLARLSAATHATRRHRTSGDGPHE